VVGREGGGDFTPAKRTGSGMALRCLERQKAAARVGRKVATEVTDASSLSNSWRERRGSNPRPSA